MDRNRGGDTHANRYYVALRKESVDRNIGVGTTRDSLGVSLSARRAWIEMPGPAPWRSGPASLSARRAWIEISNNLHDLVP